MGEINQFSQKHDASLSPEKKQDITNMFNRIFNKPLNKTTQIIKNDVILNGIEVISSQTELKVKVGYFYEKLFCYLCNFKHPEAGFDLVNVEKQIFIELKWDWNTDKHNAKESKFCFFNKYKTNNSDTEIFQICLSDKCQLLWFPNNNRDRNLGFLLSTR